MVWFLIDSKRGEHAIEMRIAQVQQPTVTITSSPQPPSICVIRAIRVKTDPRPPLNHEPPAKWREWARH